MEISTVSFDCYGTLIDSAAGRAAFFAALSSALGEAPQAGTPLRTAWEQAQFDLVREPYRPYKQVLRDACARLAAERGWSWEQADDERFLAATRAFQPFPDTRPVLKALRAAGLRIAILSNTDRELMAHTLIQLDIPVDVVITAEDCHAYKPSERFFEAALDALNEPPERVLHAAFGYRYDFPPARALGLRTAWINRRGDPRPPGPTPDHEWLTLWQLADAVPAAGAS
jgi:2-haloacid dehalogenase